MSAPQATPDRSTASSEREYRSLPMPETLLDAFRRAVATWPTRTAVRSSDGRSSWTWSALHDEVTRLAAGFHALGVRRGDRVALLMRNRPEFYAVDLALVSLSAVPVSLYATAPPAHQELVLADAGAVAVVTEPALRAALDSVTLPRHRILVDGPGDDGWLTLDAVGDRGAGVAGAVEPAADDVLTTVYTSGTTGAPKGVLLTHRNVLATCRSVVEALRVPSGTVIVPWLPAAHVGEHTGGYALPIYQGFEMVTVADPRRIVEELPGIRPGYFYAPPRVFEKLRAGFDSWMLGLEPDVHDRLRRDLDAAFERVRLRQAHRPVPAEAEAAAARARALVRPWLDQVGLGELRVAVVATAPNPGPLMEFFHAVGIPMGEAYGLTESAAGGTVVAPDAIRIGTVGRAGLGVELATAEDGEILIRGPHVMPGYHDRPDATAEAIDDDGWLHTGDLGRLDADGYLSVIGRAKELIIDSNGKNIAPVAVESAVAAASPLIGQVVCHGDGRPYLVALVTLAVDHVREWAASRGIATTDLTALARDERVRKEIDTAVATGNRELSRPEQIKRFHVVGEDWIPGGTELTPTGKLRRSEIARAYAGVLDQLYA